MSEVRAPTPARPLLASLLASPALHRLGPPLLLLAVLGYYAGYVKDDAYISFRYAANWAAGRGLVFNPGEAVEGYTNFLWTAAAAGLIRLGVPPLLGAKLLAGLLALLGLHWVRCLAARLARPSHPGASRGDERSAAPSVDAAPDRAGAPSVDAAPDRAAWLYAASPTLGLWAASGMEPTVVAAAAAGAALLTLRAREARGAARWGRAALAGLALAGCALLRPEGHLLVLALGLLEPRALPVALAALAPYHAWRHAVFGAWLPNTFLIKSGAGSLADGLGYAGLALLFYGHGLLLACALVALRRLRSLAALVAAGLTLAFLAYLVWVGDDEMRWFRLYAPALPFLFALAAAALPRRALAAFVLCGLITHATAWPLRGYLEQDHRAYFPLGEAIAARARPGDRALFQDAGATPFRALAVPFVDPIGLTDRRVARLFAEARWSPFRGGGPPALEARLRDELLGRDPRLIAFVAYIDRASRRDVRERFEVDPEGTLRPFLGDNSYVHGIPADPRFTSRYRFVGAWRRNDGYYLALYERP